MRASCAQLVHSKLLIRIGLLVAFIVLIIHVKWRIDAFVQIFYQHSGYELTQEQVVAAHDGSDTREAQIPRIVHQIYHNWTDATDRTIRQDWQDNRNRCIELNKDWEFKLWFTTESREFFQDNYPWFLPTYDTYPFPVQRIDALRYFLLRHYGGIYLDLDNSCSAPLDALTFYSTWITDGNVGALSNNILASAPNHPFWILLTDALPRYAWHYFFPYVTISYASGQWFVTEMWETYHRKFVGEGEEGLMRLAMDEREGGDRWVFFTQEYGGGNWENWDSEFFRWIGDHLVLLALMILGGVGAVVGMGYGVVRVIKRVVRGRKGYMRVDGVD